MAYIRKRGNQVALVHGARNPKTKMVEQQILFTFYSKAEAREAIGRERAGMAPQFVGILKDDYPQIDFNWKKIRQALEENMGLLPDLHPYREEQIVGGFRKALCTFSRQLMLSDPQDLNSAAKLIGEHRVELEYLARLIKWRLEMADKARHEKDEWYADNAFYWRSRSRACLVPMEIEEEAEELYRGGDYVKARAIFRLLIDSFDGYAEGYNYLGLIALEERNLAEARNCFEKTIEVGRRLFPKKLARSKFWTHIATRPYMRGLSNLILTLSEMGEFNEALALCDRWERECSDQVTAAIHRASIYLNLGRWKLAAQTAVSLKEMHPSEGFIEAFALYELGDKEDAEAVFARTFLLYPRAARRLLGVKGAGGMPQGHKEIGDHATGRDLLRSLHAYLLKQRMDSKAFFRRVILRYEGTPCEGHATEPAKKQKRAGGAPCSLN